MTGVAIAGDRLAFAVDMFAVVASETTAIKILTVADVVSVGVPIDFLGVGKKMEAVFIENPSNYQTGVM